MNQPERPGSGPAADIAHDRDFIVIERGGETEFFLPGLKVSPHAGQLLLFPAGWNYMHCGRVPKSGDKYVISTFFRIKPDHQYSVRHACRPLSLRDIDREHPQ